MKKLKPREFNLELLKNKEAKKLTIEEVNALARSEDLSYGKYSVKHNLYGVK